MARNLDYILKLGGVTPSEKQFAGTQGEHKAAVINLLIADELRAYIEQENAEHFFRIDIINEAGEVILGEEKPIEEITEPFYLTKRMTASGLDVTAVVRIFTEEKDVYLVQLKLFFNPLDGESLIFPDKKEELNELEERAEEVFSLLDTKTVDISALMDNKCSSASASAATAGEHLKDAIDAKNTAISASNDAKTSAETAESFALASKRDFTEAKALFSSAMKNADNHNFDPIAHEDLREKIAELADKAENISEAISAMKAAFEAHISDTDAHADIRELIGDISSALDEVILAGEELIGGEV